MRNPEEYQYEVNIIGNNNEQRYQPEAVFKPCRDCNGTGKLKAAQLAINSSGKTVRTSDTLVNCKKCGGSGYQIGIK